MNQDRLLERFLRYVKVDTTADPNSDTYPSSAGQLELGRLLLAELQELGASDVQQDDNGLVWATIPGNSPDAPVIAFNAHLDTSPETTGKNVQPQVIRDYQGGDITLPADPTQVIRVSDSPELDGLHGATLITTDGTTLLGGDDKAGLAIITEVAAFLIENPDVPRPEIRILFTCDEEIGHGVDHVDMDKLGAVACYTLDGGGANDLDIETFSADQATVTVRGVNIHPSIAKDRMVNAVRVASAYIDELPKKTLSPENTEGRDGFLHPYVIEGGVDEVQILILLRDFETEKLTEQANLLETVAQSVVSHFPGSSIDVDVQKQYRNMAEGLDKEPRAAQFAIEAHKALGREVHIASIRGGTDGSQLTERGLPTPNLSSGQHNQHSPLEWACLDQMVQAAEVTLEIIKRWAQESS